MGLLQNVALPLDEPETHALPPPPGRLFWAAQYLTVLPVQMVL